MRRRNNASFKEKKSYFKGNYEMEFIIHHIHNHSDELVGINIPIVITLP